MTAFYYFCGHEQWQPETLVRHAVAAERAGFDGLVVSEHFHPWVDDRSAAGFAFATIGAMAQATSRVRITTGVTTPLFRYHPGVVAQAAATLDRLSDGRFDLGVGTGENINEGPLGLPFPGYAERAARMKEALQIMRRLLDGEKLTFEGTYYRTDRAKLYSPPIGRVQIWMASGGPKSSVLAAEYADGIITSVKDPADTLAQVIEPARAAAAAAGKAAPRILATRWSLHASSEADAWEALSPWRGLRAPGRLEAVDPRDLRERADEMPRQEVLGRYPIVADAEAVVAIYRPLVEEVRAYIVAFQISSLDQAATIAMLGAEVLPELRAL
ncbi:MAG TPA: TIGR03557 family F420-dependent LLM class oxidoreductase [Acidimicrobiia bacterium]|nr:TIGR03557 family F420-dependent LLM class oxidoreductase [Acidimicrobiia bacterium]